VSPSASFEELPQAFPGEARQAVYRAIFERRDMRHFAGETVQPETLHSSLTAAHHAPSVGFMQPWRFIRILNVAMRGSLRDAVERERLATAQALNELVFDDAWEQSSALFAAAAPPKSGA